MHEVGHLFGFSQYLYDFYKDDQGNNLTNIVSHTYLKGVKTFMLKTPRLVSLAKDYFACDSIEGVFLENQGFIIF